jgi:hypothetical protein
MHATLVNRLAKYIYLGLSVATIRLYNYLVRTKPGHVSEELR